MEVSSFRFEVRDMCVKDNLVWDVARYGLLTPSRHFAPSAITHKKKEKLSLLILRVSLWNFLFVTTKT